VVKVIIEARAGLVPTEEQVDAFRLLGDVDLDGIIDIVDLKLIASAFGSSDARYDLNGDGIVDMRDIVTAAHNYGKSIIGQRSIESIVDVDGLVVITPYTVELPVGTHTLKCTLKYMNVEVVKTKTVELTETDTEVLVGFYFGVQPPSVYMLLPVALIAVGGSFIAFGKGRG
jgi:hypothetical protein